MLEYTINQSDDMRCAKCTAWMEWDEEYNIITNEFTLMKKCPRCWYRVVLSKQVKIDEKWLWDIVWKLQTIKTIYSDTILICRDDLFPWFTKLFKEKIVNESSVSHAMIFWIPIIRVDKYNIETFEKLWIPPDTFVFAFVWWDITWWEYMVMMLWKWEKVNEELFCLKKMQWLFNTNPIKIWNS